MRRVEYQTLDKHIAGHKVFFTYGDVVGQIVYNISQRGLLRALKTQLLVSDYIVLPASHFFESPLTFNVFVRYPQLLERGIVVPALRVEARDFKDFVEMKLSKEDDPYFRSSPLDLLRVANFLDTHTVYATSWAADDVREIYRVTLLNDLTDKKSALRLHMRGERKGNIHHFAELVKSMPEISRSMLLKYADQIFERRSAIMKRYLNLLYYLCGGPGLDKSLHSSAFSLFGAKYSELPNKVNVQVGQEVLFSSYLEMMHLNPKALDRLSVEDVLFLRHSPEGELFRQAWRELFRYFPDNFDLRSVDELMGVWKERLSREINRESNWADLFSRGKLVLDMVSLIIGIIAGGTVNPLVGVASIGLEIALIDPIMDFFLRRSGKLRLTVFSNLVRKAQRK